MNREERRRNGQRGANGIAAPVQPKPQVFGVVPAGRAEQIMPDGTKVAIMLFHVMTTDGTLLIEKTDAGNVPVVIAAQPIAIGRALVVPGRALAH